MSFNQSCFGILINIRQHPGSVGVNRHLLIPPWESELCLPNLCTHPVQDLWCPRAWVASIQEENKTSSMNILLTRHLK